MNTVQFIQAMDGGPAGTGTNQASALFIRAYGHDPEGVWSAPGRVNLIGEHTDYNGGLCLPIALPHRTFLALSPRRDDLVHLVSSKGDGKTVEVHLDGLEAGGVQGWSAYPVGVAWALRSMGMDGVHGFDAAFVSSVPVGGGLSSSAAMTCSSALALDDVFGLGLGGSDRGRVRLIQAAMMAENDMAGASTGGMDQNASMRCQPGHALRLDCRSDLDAMHNVRQEEFDLKSMGLELLVVDTQAPHQLNDGQYAQRRRTCEEAARTLGVSDLRVVADRVNGSGDPQTALARVLEALPDQVSRRRVRHVISEIGRVDDFISAFAARDVVRAGELFNASHDSLRDDYQVTVPELDTAVNVARADGAYGARMTGGGFGGSIIALVDAGLAAQVAQDIADEFRRKGFHEPRALSAVASSSARREA
ncbi:galactokinase [Bifidobacterium favimelis]|uniref:Galactokinase n=1 Tax=Bifidobacterium favimelis TaxID=3122979 RepID=A0ABU8ZQT3_9BIFI